MGFSKASNGSGYTTSESGRYLQYRQQQEKLFVEIAKRCLNVPERAIVKLLDQ